MLGQGSCAAQAAKQARSLAPVTLVDRSMSASSTLGPSPESCAGKGQGLSAATLTFSLFVKSGIQTLKGPSGKSGVVGAKHSTWSKEEGKLVACGYFR